MLLYPYVVTISLARDGLTIERFLSKSITTFWGRRNRLQTAGNTDSLLFLSFNFDINTGCDRKDFKLVDRVESRVEDVEKANVGSDLELLT